MKKMMVLLVVAFTVLVFTASAVSGIQSLRGSSKLDSDANDVQRHKVEIVKGGIKRNFEKQPPLIPHGVEKYQISLRNNGCMKCHSEKTYKKEKAPRVGDSHYIDRDGNVLKALSSRRYFCSLCHVIQVEGDELVENVYVGGS